MHSILRQRAQLDGDEWEACKEAFASIPAGVIRTKQELRSALAKLGQHLTDDELQELSLGNDCIDFTDFARLVEEQKRRFLQANADKYDAVRAFESMGGATGAISMERMRQLCQDFCLNCDVEDLAVKSPSGEAVVPFDKFRELWEGGLSVPQSRELEFSDSDCPISQSKRPKPPAPSQDTSRRQVDLLIGERIPKPPAMYRALTMYRTLSKLRGGATKSAGPITLQATGITSAPPLPSPPKADPAAKLGETTASRTTFSRRIVPNATGPNRLYRL
eukprot:TRINITY_DN9164_c0_g1_i1.p1 TRINITY_DN9164_c0_g1~~TRINITY_DN9164_c0_g1_i1.p1  ORF type:complete len:276 (-),score=38.94 TRINITY_DN9164_c0_g1_i1:180-1007(-)